jgi:hypothetical protein
MIELSLRIKSDNQTESISVELVPNDSEACIIEKDVLAGLFPHITNLLNGLLGGEGFRKSEKQAQAIPETESLILDKNGAPTSIPMDEEYLRKKGLIEPEEGPEIRDKDSTIIID